MEKQQVIQPQIRRYLYQKAARNKTPISGTFELTPRCNMNCRMCYIRMSEDELKQRGREFTAEEWIQMGKDAVKEGMLFLLLTGGEPFLRKDFKEIYTELSKMGLVLSINSNATLINEETVKWLAKNPPAKINVTLYGKSNDTYSRLCQCPDGYDRATRAIDMMREAGIFVNVNASFTKYNIDDMDEIIGFARDRELNVNVATYMFPPVRSAREGVTDDEVRFTPEEAGFAQAKAERLRLSEEEYERRLRAIHAGVRVVEDEEECPRVEDEHMGCMAGRSSFWITWDGRMTPCGMMNDPVVRPFEEGFSAAWKKIYTAIEEIYLPKECSGCKKRFACMMCGALTKAESGGLSNVKPEYLCKLTDQYLWEAEKEYERRGLDKTGN